MILSSPQTSYPSGIFWFMKGLVSINGHSCGSSCPRKWVLAYLSKCFCFLSCRIFWLNGMFILSPWLGTALQFILKNFFWLPNLIFQQLQGKTERWSLLTWFNIWRCLEGQNEVSLHKVNVEWMAQSYACLLPGQEQPCASNTNKACARVPYVSLLQMQFPTHLLRSLYTEYVWLLIYIYA